jgi:hypothetical protein
MKTLILSQNDIVAGSNNTVLEYAFPSGGIQLKEKTRVALSSVTMYNSTPNISITYNNNSFQYRWVDGATYTVSIADGFYEISDLNNYLHQTMYNNKHYLLNSSNQIIWFITLAVNTSNYKIDAIFYPLSLALYPTATFPLPSGSTWTMPGISTIPQLVIQVNAFRTIVGFQAGIFPSTNLFTTIQTASSSEIPQVSPLSSYTIKCNLVNNQYSIPNSLIYSFPPSGSFGQQFHISPNEYSYIDCSAGNYGVFRVEFSDQADRPVVILDPNITVLIVLKDSDE